MERSINHTVEEYLEYFPCVAVIGPRQCGKTTLLHSLNSGWNHFDLEKGADIEQISADPDLFLRLNPNKVTIDEAQLFPSLFKALRVSIDSNRGVKGRFILTGSSSPELITSITESLAGRVGIIEMAPLTFSEVLGSKNEYFYQLLIDNKLDSTLEIENFTQNGNLSLLHDFWLKGGYPEPWINRNNKRFHSTWMTNYVTSYLHRDIKLLFPGIDEIRFRKFLSMLASSSGQVLNYSDMARSLDVSQPTIKDYLFKAHHTFIWRTLPSFEKNVHKRIIKHPKGHLRDSGLLYHLLRISDRNGLLSHPRMGRFWESFVSEQILTNLQARGIPFDASYYRTSAGAEVDLILKGNFGCFPADN